MTATVTHMSNAPSAERVHHTGCRICGGAWDDNSRVSKTCPGACRAEWRRLYDKKKAKKGKKA